jgi:hypothetical protein
MNGRLLVAGAVLLTALLTGCGVPAEDTPHEVELPGGPYPAFGTAAPRDREVGTAEEPLCFVRDDRLVRVVRRVRSWPTVETQIQHLVAGPDAAEQRAGLTSALAGTTVVTGIRLARGEVTVELGEPVTGAGRSDEVLAYGQVVCSLTTRTDVTSVSFAQDGEPVGIPRADGSLSRAPLTAADYAELMS